MGIQAWTFLIVGLSFVLYIWIAIRSRAGSTHEFYVAGGGVSPLANGMATAADWMSAASFISMAGIISFMGRDGSVYLMGWTGGYVLLALLLAPYLRKFGAYTVPAFVGQRYASQTARLVAICCALFISFTYVAGQMRGVGIVFSRFLGVDIEMGVVIGMVIVFIYAVLGGMKGITYTQVAQYCVLIFAYTVPAVYISLMMTDSLIPQVGFGGVMDRLDGLSTELGFAAYTAGNKAMIDVFCITAALMVGTAGLPHVIVRFFTVPRVRDARLSAGYALLFIAVLYTTAPAVAAFARTNLIETIADADPEALPDWVRNWEVTGLLAHEDKDGDGVLRYRADAAANEWTIDRDIIVLANPEIAGLPDWVVGLVAAGALAAALSTAAGLLLVISTSVSHDLYKGMINPAADDKRELLVARGAAATAVLIAGHFGVYPPGFVAQTVAYAFGLAASSFFPVILLGIFSKRVHTAGAVAGMVSGLLFTGGYILWFTYLDPASNNPAGWWLGISPEGIGTMGALVNVTVTLAVTTFTAPPPADVQALVDRMRVPRG